MRTNSKWRAHRKNKHKEAIGQSFKWKETPAERQIRELIGEDYEQSSITVEEDWSFLNLWAN